MPDPSDPRLVFAGTPKFAATHLRAMMDAGIRPLAVYTRPDRPSGRGRKIVAGAVRRLAETAGLEVRQPSSLNDAGTRAELAALRPDLAVVVAYGSILPQSILDIPANGCLNIHASLLPRWRGAAPIQRAIMAGDETTGICIMRMDAGLDTGPVLLTREVRIGAEETAGELHDRLAELGGRAVVEALEKLDTLRARPQAESGATYAAKIGGAEARIAWTESALTVDRKIRGLSPFPGAWCECEGQRIGVLASHHIEATGSPGRVLDGQLTVACGDGAVRLLRLQRAGKKVLAGEAFLRGFPIPANTLLD